MQDDTETSLAADIHCGVPAIARFLSEDERSVYHLCARGYIPCGKEGDRWIASKSRLRQHYDAMTGGARTNEAAD
jgi:hypothetical protein